VAPALDIRPLTGCIGAEIEGLDLKAELAAEVGAALRQALFDHQVLFFRDQHLGIARQKQVTEIFGPLITLPYVVPTAEDPFVIAVLKKAEDRNVGVFGGNWHSDFSFVEAPPAGSLLNAVTIPPFGGDTVWANQIAAYETLSEDLRNIVEGRGAIHTGKPYGVKHSPPKEKRSGASIQMTRDDPEADRERVKPAVLTHPQSGRKALFVNPTYTTRLDGMSEAESRPILDALYWHCTRPDFCCRFRWSPGTLAVWDNRTTMHYAVNDYEGHDRLLYRTAFGDAGVQAPAA